MKDKKIKLLSKILTLAMAFSLFAAMPATAGASSSGTTVERGNITDRGNLAFGMFRVINSVDSSGVTLMTTSYAKGNFDPWVAVWNESGLLIGYSDDIDLVSGLFDAFINMGQMADGFYTYTIGNKPNKLKGSDTFREEPVYDYSAQYELSLGSGLPVSPQGSGTEWSLTISGVAPLPVAFDDNYGPGGYSDTFRLKGNVMDNDRLSPLWATDFLQNIVRNVRTMDGEAEFTVDDAAGLCVLPTSNGGWVWISNDGDFLYQPAADFSGADTFQYQLKEGGGGTSGLGSRTSEWATVTFNVPKSAFEREKVVERGVITDAGDTASGTFIVDNALDSSGVTLMTTSYKRGNFDPWVEVRNEGGQLIGYGDDIDASLDNLDAFIDMGQMANGVYTYIVGNKQNTLRGSEWILLISGTPATSPQAENDNYGTGGFDAAFRLQGNVMENDILSNHWYSSMLQNIVWQARTADGEQEITVNDASTEFCTLVTYNGKVWIGNDGEFMYKPNGGFTGADTFQYRLRGGKSEVSEWATVTINVPSAIPTSIPVVWSSLSANGKSGLITTNELTLVFDVNPTALTAAHITVSGAAKGVLTGTGKVRKLTISNVTVANGMNVTVQIDNPSGFTIAPSSKTVAIIKSEKPGDINGDGKVDATDLSLLIADFGKRYDVRDLAILLANFGQ